MTLGTSTKTIRGNDMVDNYVKGYLILYLHMSFRGFEFFFQFNEMSEYCPLLKNLLCVLCFHPYLFF